MFYVTLLKRKRYLARNDIIRIRTNLDLKHVTWNCSRFWFAL